MDMAKSRLKTNSNGSLHSTYTAYGSHLHPASTVPRGQAPVQRQPLRSISHNSSLPSSSGPLISMLKTTTEMGNVGTFPLQQRPVTPMTYHQLPRARPDLIAATPPPRYTPKKYDNFYYPDDHRPFRSYRDTTSEIISLYAYENQPLYYGSGSPTLDDASHRSYSITTNSSRYLPSQKSLGNMQSHSGRSELQRPRSPFPYPTRLKRPGVRPASPAVAENGYVDYSRMIELDRVSQRTVRGSYKPNSMKWPRRPPLSSIRPDHIRSATSLPLRASPSPYHTRSGSYRSRTPSSSQSSASRYGRFERHARMPMDRGERSPSLSSIAGMYRQPSVSRGSRPPIQTPCHFYYDYSEDFDNPAVLGNNVEQEPLHLNTAECDVEGGTSNSDPETNVSAITRGVPHDEDPLEQSNKDTISSNKLDGGPPVESEHGAFVQVGHQLGEILAVRRLSQSAPPDGIRIAPRVSQDIRERRTESINSGEVHNSKTLGPSRILGSQSVTEQFSDEARSQGARNDAECTPDQSLPDFMSIFGTFDLVARSPCLKATTVANNRVDEAGNIGDMGDTDSIHSKDHRRHAPHDLVRAAKNSIEGCENELSLPLSPSLQNQKLNILSPEPISPVRGLKVKNSIPQLMKALPPLPSKLSQVVQSLDDDMVTDDDQQSVDGTCHDEGVTQDKLLSLESPCPQDNVASAKRISPSKFKVRMKSSASQMADINGASSSKDPAYSERLSEAPPPQAKPKLKIKISRTQLGQGRCLAEGAFPRVNRLKQCNSLADLALYSPKPAQTAARTEGNTEESRHESCPNKLQQSFDGANEDLPNPAHTSPQPSDPFNIPYPSSPSDMAENNKSISSSNKDTLVPEPSCSPGTSPRQDSRLRKKMSVFRLRIVDSVTASATKKEEKAGQLQRCDSHLSVGMTSKDSQTNIADAAKHAGKSNRAKNDWVTTRVKRWAINARRAVRSYMRRTLERSPR